jgi:hypothetical protein
MLFESVLEIESMVQLPTNGLLSFACSGDWLLQDDK